MLWPSFSSIKLHGCFLQDFPPPPGLNAPIDQVAPSFPSMDIRGKPTDGGAFPPRFLNIEVLPPWIGIVQRSEYRTAHKHRWHMVRCHAGDESKESNHD